MEDGKDEEEARAAKLDGWIIRETREDSRIDQFVFSSFSGYISFVKGDSHPEISAQRTDEGDGFPWYEDLRVESPRWGPWFPSFPLPFLKLHIPWG
jgi:hypothetical protein